MGRVGFAAALAVVGMLAIANVAWPCGALRATARIDAFSCNCDERARDIYEVTGTAVVSNARATPLLGSLVVEIQTKEGHQAFVPVARQVLNAFGASAVETCQGLFSAGPVEGRIVLIDKDGDELGFDDVKHLMHGQTSIMFVATFAGTIPHLNAGDLIRIKVYTTAVDADVPLPCQVDGDGDGVIDGHVNTLTFKKIVRVPTTSFLIVP